MERKKRSFETDNTSVFNHRIWDEVTENLPDYQTDPSQSHSSQNIRYWTGDEYEKLLEMIKDHEKSDKLIMNSEDPVSFLSENIWYWLKGEHQRIAAQKFTRKHGL